MIDWKPRVSDIQTTDVLYYDPGFVTQGYQFCKKRNIDCLPVIDNPTAYYQRNDDLEGFVEREITPDRQIGASSFIFRPDMLDQFRQHSLQFVFDGEEFTGVVHFSDYNNGGVYTYLYSVLSEYEKNLRELAIHSRLKNGDILAYFGEKAESADESRKPYFESKVAYCQRKQNEMDQVEEFQLFYLEDLLCLLRHRRIMQLDGKVIDLRNMIMHSHRLVEKVETSADDLIFDFNSFKRYFKRVEVLLRDEKRVNNRVAFMQRLESIGLPP